jgi:multidrug efflux pump subunit AcrB
MAESSIAAVAQDIIPETTFERWDFMHLVVVIQNKKHLSTFWRVYPDIGAVFSGSLAMHKVLELQVDRLVAVATQGHFAFGSKAKRNRSVTLVIIPPRNVPLEEAVATVQRDVIDKLQRDGAIPEGVSLGIGGASDKLQATKEALSGNFLIAIVLSYLLLVAILSHWAYPMLILLSLPLGISGGLAGLWFMNTVLGIVMPLDMITLLGMIVLIGTVVNNPILLVEQRGKTSSRAWPR